MLKSKKYLKEKRGQSSFEALLVAGVIILGSTILGAYYTGSISDQTTAIIILKTELLGVLNGLDKQYTIVSAIEPLATNNGDLCFEIELDPTPITGSADETKIENAKTTIASAIAAKTKYKLFLPEDIKIFPDPCSPVVTPP